VRAWSDGFIAAANGAMDFLRDLFAFSTRRLWAIAWHSILESIRRRMLLAVFGVLVVIFMFGGWFLPSKPTEQVKVYVSFVFLSSTLIAVAAGWLLACLSLPSDIRDKTIHTVVTKPVRRLEIVVGRIIGLTIISTGILMAMGLVSFSMVNFASWSEIVFKFTPEPGILVGAFVFATVMGLLGGFFPALRAARTNPIEAMRS
jgi:ABC-type transport system involved in multi-copper enzyme maturation permease subunit